MKKIPRIALMIFLQLGDSLPDNLSDFLVLVLSEFVSEANDTIATLQAKCLLGMSILALKFISHGLLLHPELAKRNGTPRLGPPIGVCQFVWGHVVTVVSCRAYSFLDPLVYPAILMGHLDRNWAIVSCPMD